jgi:uncharacterized protein involved in exopolysaccharide biosynthesis
MKETNNSDINQPKKDFFNLREFLEKYLFHWKWFVLSFLIALFCSFLYLRYTTPEFEVVSTVLIQDCTFLK